MRNINLLIAAHKKYKMPLGNFYMPIFVGSKNKVNIGYQRDDEGENISEKNPYFCELTALYWGWKNLGGEFLGLVHYRRYFTNKNFLYRLFHKKQDCILEDIEIKNLLEENEIILPKKRNYYIETIYSHYSHTHYEKDLILTKKIIGEKHSEYLKTFDFVLKQKKAHMFNMYIMKKEYSDQYCEWLFDILFELEKEIDIKKYDAFQARVFGRISEILLNVWVLKNRLKYKEIGYINIENINWCVKGKAFLAAKFKKEKYGKSF